MCKDKLWIKPQITSLHHWDQNVEVKRPATDLSSCLPAYSPSCKHSTSRCCLAPVIVLHPWAGQLPGNHPWNTSKKTDYGVFWISTFFFTCPAYLYSNLNSLGTWTWKIPHILSQIPLRLVPLAPTELKNGRSFPIPSKKCILEQAYLTLYYLKVRNKYVKPLAAKWTVHPLGKKHPAWAHWSHETICQEKTF